MIKIISFFNIACLFVGFYKGNTNLMILNGTLAIWILVISYME